MTLRPLLAIVAAALFPLSLLAAPQINNVSQRGVKIGQPVQLVFEGVELAPEPRIVSSLSIKSQQVAPDANPGRVAVEIVVDPSAEPGIYAVRLASTTGISNPVLLAVDHLPQAAFGEEIAALPVALSGALGGADVKRTSFAGKKGQKVVIDVEAQRLGANFKPVVRLYDARGRQVTFAASQPWIGGDARCIATLPEDGKYTIELHDRVYRAGAPGMFRLKVGEFLTADRAHPAAVPAGGAAKLTLLGGNMPAEAVTEFNAANQIPGDHPAAWPRLPLATGMRPSVLISGYTEFVEPAAPNGIQEAGAPSLGISGVLAAAGEEDRFALTVTPGQRLRVEVHARRLGSPIDGVLAIRNEQGAQLAGADDVPGSHDPMIADFPVPGGVNKIVVAVKDLLNRGGADFNYRIVVRDLGKPDFALSIATDRILIPAGGTQVVQVQAERTSYGGPIKLELSGLPSNIQVQGAELAAGASMGLLTVSAPAGVTGAGLIKLVGRIDAATPIARTVRGPMLPGSQLAPYLRDEIGFGVAPALPIGVTWTTASDTLVQGTSLAATAQLTRAANTPGNIRLRLLTNQPVIKKKIKENNMDKEVDDLARILRLNENVVVPPDKTEASPSLFVPGDLPATSWDATLVAELLSPDGKNVVATAYAPVKRFKVDQAFKLELTSANAAEGKTGVGPAGKFTGKLVRSAGYDRPVLVTLSGLPKGYAAPVVEVPGDKSEFEFPLNFPFESKPGELKNVQLVAVADRNNPAAARSQPVPVSVTLTPGEKPPAEKPLEIFEDDEKFIAALNQGGGMITADGEKHSGKVALRVTPDQKFNPKMPGVEFKIREVPGPGEYRYLRFAWRKKQGNLICLQLAHDGMFGPGGNSREGAKFRYHSGPGGEPFGGSVLVDGKLPNKYVVVTRDLFADFGEFTLTGFSFSAIDGQSAYFDGLYLGRTPSDFELIEVK